MVEREKFKKTIDAVYHCDYYNVRMEIMKRCNISKTAWGYWYRGIIIPSRKYWIIIDSVLEEYGYKPIFKENANNGETQI